MVRRNSLDAKKAFNLRSLTSEEMMSKISLMSDREVVDFLEFLDLDEATAVICMIPMERRARIVKRFNASLDKKTDFLSKFELTLVEGLMDFNYVEVDVDDSIELMVSKIRTHEQRVGAFPTILVLQEGKILGSLPGHVLSIVDDRNVSVGSVVLKHLRRVPKINYKMKRKEIISKFESDGFKSEKAVVVDDDRRVVGILYVDALMRLVGSKAAEALYDFAGVDDEERAEDGFWKKFKFRYNWLLINLGTTFIAAGVVSLMGGVLSKEILLAAFMPVVSGMGGNAATQTLAVMVRTLSLESVDKIGFWKLYGIWKNEAIAGAMNGFLTGGIVGVVGAVVSGHWKLGVVISFAVLFNLFISAFFGTVVPYFMKKAGKDPATSATIFITTATDVLGFVAFLGMANILY